MRFVAYLAGCPSGPKNKHKHQILWDFVRGVNTLGDKGILHQGRDLIDSDVAFIQGWVHENSGTTPHLMLRKSVIQHQRANRNKLLVADSNLFNYIDGNAVKDYIRYSFDGIFPTTGNYFNSVDYEIDPVRWEKIFKNKGITLKNWRKKGSHILICTQRNGGWSMKGLDVPTWLDQTVREIRKYTDRPILVRGHPGDRYHKQYIDQKKYTLSSSPLITQDFADCHAVITYNSSPAVAAAIEGVPVYVTDPSTSTSQAAAVANTDLSTIEKPKTFERDEWLSKLAMSHWNTQEIANGEAWRHIRKFV